MKMPKHRVAPRGRDNGAHSDIFWKACRIGSRESQLSPTALRPDRPADWSLGRDMNSTPRRGFNSACNLELARRRQAHAGIARNRDGGNSARRTELDDAPLDYRRARPA